MCEELKPQPAETAPEPASTPALPPTPPSALPEPQKSLESGNTESAALEPSSPEAGGTELADWKASLREDFEHWLAGIKEAPEWEEVKTESGETPGLYSFYEQLAATAAETRKANRRTAEAISQWGETLSRFEGSLAPLRETVAALAAAQPKEEQMSRAHCLVLVELLDRLYRLARAFQSPPQRTSWWGGSDAAWRPVWDTQRQAFAILVSHLEQLLQQEGVTHIETVGHPFDPAVMTALAAEPDATRPPHTILEELAPGYRRHGELLRPAQVKVSRQP